MKRLALCILLIPAITAAQGLQPPKGGHIAGWHEVRGRIYEVERAADPTLAIRRELINPTELQRLADWVDFVLELADDETVIGWARLLELRLAWEDDAGNGGVVTGIKPPTIPQKLYPNPTSGAVFYTGTTAIPVYDIAGRHVGQLQPGAQRIPFASGVYFAQGPQTIRFVVVR